MFVHETAGMVTQSCLQPVAHIALQFLASACMVLYLIAACIAVDCSKWTQHVHDVCINFHAHPRAVCEEITQDFMESSAIKIVLFVIILVAPYVPLLCSSDVASNGVVLRTKKVLCNIATAEIDTTDRATMKVSTLRNSGTSKEEIKSAEEDATPLCHTSSVSYNCNTSATEHCDIHQEPHPRDADHAHDEHDSASDDVQTIDYSQDLEYEHNTNCGGGGDSGGRSIKHGRAQQHSPQQSSGDSDFDRVMQQSIADPRVLVGWQIAIHGDGVGVVVGTIKRKFSTTKFTVEMESGEVLLLALQRSKHKGNVPFTLLQKLR